MGISIKEYLDEKFSNVDKHMDTVERRVTHISRKLNHTRQVVTLSSEYLRNNSSFTNKN